MDPKCFLAYGADPFSLDEPVFAIKLSDEASPKIVKFDLLQSISGPILTYQAPVLTEALRVRALPPLPLFDLRHALQLVSGRPKKEFEASEWGFARWLGTTRLQPWERDALISICNGASFAPSQGTLAELLLKVCVAFQDGWNGLTEELRQLGEYERFISIEIPVQQLMLKRQWLGIRVDEENSKDLLRSATSDKYKAMLRLGDALKINPSGLNYKSVLPYLENSNAGALVSFADSRSLPSYFKMAALHSTIARDFRLMMQANRNIKSLLTISTSGKRAFPILDSMGTVTSRIQTSNPNVQQLRRCYRSALVADVGMHNGYFDFAQFEPGILAQYVGPGPFRELYNSGDVYTELSKAVFNTHEMREAAKQIFIAFCYGMELEAMGRLLGTFGHTDGWLYASAVEQFFERFPELLKYKNECESALENNGFVATAFGNRRNRVNSGTLRRKERSWAMNHIIQSTGSLIFKCALLALAERFGEEAILLPVHDAVWIQAPVNASSLPDFNRTVQEIMQRAFSKWCPDVNVRIKDGSFQDT